MRFVRIRWNCNPLIISDSDHQNMFQLNRDPAHVYETLVALDVAQKTKSINLPIRVDQIWWRDRDQTES